jgi:response regulator RpfG family c-di-GMP phosphodiesterase
MMTEKILCVDDDPYILSSYQRSLNEKFVIDTALGPEKGLAALKSEKIYAVMVCDMAMPGMDGIELMRQAKEISPDTVRIMLTGHLDQAITVQAINQGQVFQFLNKPCPPEVLGVAIDAGIKQYRLLTAERDLLEKTLRGSVQALMNILSMTDPTIFGKAQKVRGYISRFAHLAKDSSMWELEIAALLCRMGWVSMPDTVLEKVKSQQPLSIKEREMFVQTPKIGHDWLMQIPRLESVAKLVLYQNKSFDGTGFPPDELGGSYLPQGARLLKVLYDFMDLIENEESVKKVAEKMSLAKGNYDPQCLREVLDALTEEESSLDKDNIVLSVSVDELRPGDRLAVPVRTKDGVIILLRGYQITAMVLEKIRNFSKLGNLREPFVIHKRSL